MEKVDKSGERKSKNEETGDNHLRPGETMDGDLERMQREREYGGVDLGTDVGSDAFGTDRIVQLVVVVRVELGRKRDK